VSPTYPVERTHFHGCSVVLRQFKGAQASELFFSCQPPADSDPGDQTAAVYSAILEVLRSKGGSYSDVITETCFLRNASRDLPAVREARSDVLAKSGISSHRPSVTEVEQHPLTGKHSIEVLIYACVPAHGPIKLETYAARTICDCSECARAHAILMRSGQELHLCAGNLYGAGPSAFEQTTNMFEVADDLLQQAGMNFSDVMRTWIYLPEMERDYSDFNRARRQFFKARGIDPVPASTGIGARLIAKEHKLSLGICAIKSEPQIERIVMTTPTLNEAPEYGSDFSRGMRVWEANKISILVSGTASIDEGGTTVYVDDFEGQARRMLLNVEALLKAQGANFSDVVYAITYLKHPEDSHRLEEIFHEAGYEGFPNVIVAAEVCRPELLCETELVAVLSAARV